MSRGSVLPDWEEQTERRLGILEQKMDKLLDPETGIYPKIRDSQHRLERMGLGILTAVTVNLVLRILGIGGI